MHVHAHAYMQVRNPLRSMGRKIKGPLWGTDMLIIEALGSGQEQLAIWADKIEESMHESRLVDSYKMQVGEG